MCLTDINDNKKARIPIGTGLFYFWENMSAPIPVHSAHVKKGMFMEAQLFECAV